MVDECGTSNARSLQLHTLARTLSTGQNGPVCAEIQGKQIVLPLLQSDRRRRPDPHLEGYVVAAHLEQGQRLENLSWRLWHLHNLMVDSDADNNAKSRREFKRLSRHTGERVSLVSLGGYRTTTVHMSMAMSMSVSMSACADHTHTSTRPPSQPPNFPKFPSAHPSYYKSHVTQDN
ncbi:hypothetical protein AG1IA_07222 [Rhizoctonia solani AG-1 IA]|uniref:Nitrogen regulatory protein areA GATA-like domain-containing protein n=1 Tax=Thanatephorus cucumeris (strain AG1-IA) TaxID=983506 RepID=L8WPQ5_THACA|nr:hypothetical protein AG1IA_07222 [Rhizoctonia solani AG-1 IA]